MKQNEYSEIILNENDIMEGLYSGKITDLSNINIDDESIIESFNAARKQNADFVSDLTVYTPPQTTVEEFDMLNQDSWFMPDEYKEFDIINWLFDECKTPVETDRVATELELFVQFNMIDVLKYLKYLVDTMRNNNVVLGVGRGSSVASYCLFLIGVHKVDSIKYELDIHEFLK